MNKWLSYLKVISSIYFSFIFKFISFYVLKIINFIAY